MSDKKYDIILADPPWEYYGSKTKDQAAGKWYDCMSDVDIMRLGVRDRWASDRSVIFMWTTCPRLDLGIEVLKEWGFYFRGVGFVWIKTKSDCVTPIGAQGVRPSIIKPTTELVIVGSTVERGRPLPLKSESVRQVVWDVDSGPEAVLSPRPENVHSRKPEVVRSRIDELFSVDHSRIELFARRRFPGWDAWGDQLE